MALKLGLLENSHAYLVEAVDNALAARSDVRKWQFAILNLCQSLELSIKAFLASIHPVLVFDNIDQCRNTVSLKQGLQRLQSPVIGAIPITSQENASLDKLIELRNKITHADFELTEQYAEAKFFEVFAFIGLFQAHRLHTEIEKIIEPIKYDQLLEIKKALYELHVKAIARIKAEEIAENLIWLCPNCDRDTFVVHNAIDTCYTCRHQTTIAECPRCSVSQFEHDLLSIVDAFDVDIDEGISVVYNDYGYGSIGHICEYCAIIVREDIQRQREDNYFDDEPRNYL